ncbi:hypothetical protein VTJ49DRAFT_5470 [Mycothermus thermophilus]|uniref:CFEM domain-containing protein n=1 Tax=Humicola insolens TaxID=85995 RepID=A0ABR3V372_HUMIN
MKTSVSLVALAAGASATFLHAPPFTFPGNIDNKCTPQQQPGFNWADLDFGDFFNYKDFIFKGWKCEDESGKRSRITPRTFGKVIGGVCTSDKFKSPSFGCGPNLDKFSLGSILVKPEFDTDLEFHYDMPDGKTCKHRSHCKAKGTTIINNQCGGAKNVTIVYPPQPNKPKPTCSIKVPTISFDCSTASSTKPPKTKTSTSFTSTSTVVTTSTSDSPAESTTTSDTPDVPTSTASSTSTLPDEGSSTTTVPGSETSSDIVPGTSTTSSDSASVSTTESLSPGDSTSSSQQNTASETTAIETTTVETTVVETTAIPVTETVTLTTSFETISTIFTTTTQTITQCEPTKPDCPGNSISTTIVTIPVSTTICPVTETITTTTVLSSTVVVSSTVIVSSNLPAGPSSSDNNDPNPGTSTLPAGGPSSLSTSILPLPTLNIPVIVPSCLNTFIFTTGCTDNTDAACYCPDAVFVKNVYDCLYAHGETDAIIAEAIAYFQGICGKYLPQNPGIATDATVTSYITVTATPTVAPVYTTVTLITTTIVPCTDDDGSVIPSSSTTVTISTSMEVPQVDFTSTGGSDVVVIPITTPADEAPSVPVTGIITAVPTVSTGTVRPTQSIVTAGSGRVGVSLGLAAAVAAVAALAM